MIRRRKRRRCMIRRRTRRGWTRRRSGLLSVIKRISRAQVTGSPHGSSFGCCVGGDCSLHGLSAAEGEGHRLLAVATAMHMQVPLELAGPYLSPPGIHYSLPCTISDTIADILSPWLLLGVGWQFTLSISGATVVVPGVGTFPLRFVPSPHTCYAVDIVPAVTLGCPEGSYTLFDPANSSHSGLPVTELLS